MDLKVSIPCLLVCYLLFYCKWVQGYTKLSKEEDLELDEQLKHLNKPAVKTIKTKYGDIYDCVDFYEQPAFDHPSLKNHNFQLEVQSRKVTLKEKIPKSKSVNIALEGGGCPFGTVPIRRTSKDDLIRAKVYSNMFASKVGPLADAKPGIHHAMIQTLTKGNYEGVRASLSYWNLPVKAPQYTSGRIKIINGVESIEAGWTVNPGLYGDNQTHLYIYTNARESHCFNAQCGYVHVRPDIPVDMVLDPVSSNDGGIYEVTLSIIKEEAMKHWVLRMNDEEEDPIDLGYWPNEIFSKLGGESGRQAEWGGEVFRVANMAGPGMGSGHPLELNSNYDAYCRNVKVVLNKTLIDPPQDSREFKDTSLYDVTAGNAHAGFGYLTLYGGDGLPN